MQYFVDLLMLDGVSEFLHMKRRLGERIRALREGAEAANFRKQEALSHTSGVGRDIISDIENGSTDYRINGLLKVLAALHADETILFADDSIEDALTKKLVRILRQGDPADRNYIMSVIERAFSTLDKQPPTTRSGTPRSSGKSHRFA